MWRCGLCGGMNPDGEPRCTWPAKGGLWRSCEGEKPRPRLRAGQLGRGIGNKPKGYRSDR